MKAAVLLTLAVSLACCLADDLRLTRVERKIRLETQIVQLQDQLTVTNAGKRPSSSVVICKLADLAPHEAVLQVFLGDAKDQTTLQVTPVDVPGAPENVTCLAASLPKAVQPGGSVNLQVVGLYTHLLQPKPAAIAQDEVQRMVYQGPLHLLSPYPIATQTVRVRLPNSKVESYTPTEAASRSGSKLVFGPFTELEPWAAAPLRVHYESTAPFAVATSLVREVEVSHWGNIYVEERYSLRHAGAKHKGSWSRLDYASNPARFGASAFRGLNALLPPSANTLYFRDEIGNISTSAVRFGRERVEALLEPRFPMFGGWSSNFVFGYSLPLRDFVASLPGGRRQLTALFGSPIMGLVVDDLTVRIVLPEGASDIGVEVPFPVERSTDVKYTYGDTVGRPVVVLRKRNVVPEHQQPYLVAYNFPRLALLKEPAMAVAGFSLLFLGVMVWVRCEFSLSRKAKQQ